MTEPKPSQDVVTGDAVATHGGATAADKITMRSNAAVAIASTFTGEDFATKVRVFDAVSNALPISEHVGETINLRNWVGQVVEVADEDGELQSVVRVILVDADGTAYAALSDGLYRALVNIAGVIGLPDTWSNPIAVKVVEQRSRKGFRFFTLKIA